MDLYDVCSGEGSYQLLSAKKLLFGANGGVQGEVLFHSARKHACLSVTTRAELCQGQEGV